MKILVGKDCPTFVIKHAHLISMFGKSILLLLQKRKNRSSKPGDVVAIQKISGMNSPKPLFFCLDLRK